MKLKDAIERYIEWDAIEGTRFRNKPLDDLIEHLLPEGTYYGNSGDVEDFRKALVEKMSKYGITSTGNVCVLGRIYREQRAAGQHKSNEDMSFLITGLAQGGDFSCHEILISAVWEEDIHVEIEKVE